MNSKHYMLLGLLCLGEAGALLAADAPLPTPVVNLRFEMPTNTSRMYPPETGSNWAAVAGLSGYSNDGKMELTYGTGYGLDGTGGIYGKVHQPATKVMTVSCVNLKLPMLKDSLPLTDPIRSIQFSVDAKLPVGKSFEVNIQMNVPKDVDVGVSSWANRIVLGVIEGTGNFENYTLAGADLKEKHVAAVVNYIRDLYLNGAIAMTGSLNFNFDAIEWSAGDEFLVDNIKLTIAGK